MSLAVRSGITYREVSVYTCMVCGGQAETRGAVNHSDGDDAGPGCKAWAAWDALTDLANGIAAPNGACDTVLAEVASHLARTLDAFMVREEEAAEGPCTCQPGGSWHQSGCPANTYTRRA